MNNTLLFTRKCSKPKKIQHFIKKYDLNLSYKNKKEYIYENNILMLSVTKHVLFILLYNNTKPELISEIKNFFYSNIGDTNE